MQEDHFILSQFQLELESNHSVSTQTTAVSSVQTAPRPVLPKEIDVDIPAKMTSAQIKAMIEKFYGKT